MKSPGPGGAPARAAAAPRAEEARDDPLPARRAPAGAGTPASARAISTSECSASAYSASAPSTCQPRPRHFKNRNHNVSWTLAPRCVAAAAPRAAPGGRGAGADLHDGGVQHEVALELLERARRAEVREAWQVRPHLREGRGVSD
jgi:hypothetical protein